MSGRADATDPREPPDGANSEGSDGEGVFGPFEDLGPIEPGDPSLEHALFVLLGILAGVLSTFRLVGIV